MDEKSLQRVKDLRDKGLTWKQVATEMKVSESAVKRAIAKSKKTEAEKAQAADEDRLRGLIREELEAAKDSPNNAGDGLPVMRKSGQGMEIINPEAVLRSYLLEDGEAGQWMLKGMMMLRAAQLMVLDDVAIMKGEADAHAKLMEPILRLMKETRAEQDAAAERARSSSLEAAREAAQESLGRAMPYLDERLRSVEEAAKQRAEPQSKHPFPQMMRMVDGTLSSLTGQVLKGFGFGGQEGSEGQAEIPGFTRKKRSREESSD